MTNEAASQTIALKWTRKMPVGQDGLSSTDGRFRIVRRQDVYCGTSYVKHVLYDGKTKVGSYGQRQAKAVAQARADADAASQATPQDRESRIRAIMTALPGTTAELAARVVDFMAETEALKVASADDLPDPDGTNTLPVPPGPWSGQGA
jgi:hypothetical protein